MRKPILVGTALILFAAGLAYATDQTAICSRDGETAYFTGNKKIDNNHSMERSRDVCEYSHDHTVQDANGMHTETHTFWKNCGD